MTQRTGIYSGTFDPVHPGHIAFALETLRICNLDEIIFLPECSPRGKDDIADISHRIALLNQQTKAHSNLRILRLASERFTVKNTLPELRAIFKDSELTMLIGSDVARTLLFRWESLDLLFKEVSLAIGIRENDTPAEMHQIVDDLEAEHKITIKHTVIHTQHKNLSSSQIRKRKLHTPINTPLPLTTPTT